VLGSKNTKKSLKKIGAIFRKHAPERNEATIRCTPCLNKINPRNGYFLTGAEEVRHGGCLTKYHEIPDSAQWRRKKNKTRKPKIKKNKDKR